VVTKKILIHADRACRLQRDTRGGKKGTETRGGKQKKGKERIIFSGKDSQLGKSLPGEPWFTLMPEAPRGRGIPGEGVRQATAGEKKDETSRFRQTFIFIPLGGKEPSRKTDQEIWMRKGHTAPPRCTDEGRGWKERAGQKVPI